MNKEELYKKRFELIKELSKINQKIRDLEYDGKDYSGKFIKIKHSDYTEYMKVKTFHSCGNDIQFFGNYFEIENEPEEIMMSNNYPLLVSAESLNDEVEIISKESYFKTLSDTLKKYYENQVNN